MELNGDSGEIYQGTNSFVIVITTCQKSKLSDARIMKLVQSKKTLSTVLD